MEHLGFQGLAALFVLLPGFLCARIVQWLCVRPKQTELDKIIESLLYSFVVYAIFVLFWGGAVPVDLASQQSGGATHYQVHVERRPLLELVAISLVLALAVGGIVTNDLSGRFFRWLRLTQRTTRSSVWSDAFHDRGGVVQVELGDKRRIMGWLRYYSDEPHDASLFLENAAWINDDLSLVHIPGPGILLTKDLGIQSVSFLNREQCSHAEEPPASGDSEQHLSSFGGSDVSLP